MRYQLKLCEQEVTIRFDMEEKIAHIYASAPSWIRKYDKLVEEFPEYYKCVKVDELGYYKKYECPMKFIRQGKPVTNRKPMSDEQKARCVEFLKKARESKRILEADDSGEDFIEDDISDEEATENNVD